MILLMIGQVHKSDIVYFHPDSHTSNKFFRVFVGENKQTNGMSSN